MTTPTETFRARPAGSWLLLVVFVAGGALMAYEIVGSRLLAPFFGNSTFVWGSLISVFLGALASGYALGGRVADRWPRPGALALILTGSALLVGATVLLADPLQRRIIDIGLGIRLDPLVASIVLFGPASVLMGMVSPFAVRLRAGDFASLGRTAGSLYGLSTAGSIAGTLAASFWLVQDFGSEATVLAVGLALAACALVTAVAGGATFGAKAVAGVATIVLMGLIGAGAGSDEEGQTFRAAGSDFSPVFHAGGYQPEFEPREDGKLRAQADSSYHRIRVVDYDAYAVETERARVLHFDNSLQAAARLDAKNNPVVTGPPLFGYLRAFELVPAIKPKAKRVLLIGLGSGAAAMRLHELRPTLRIDVVELDPKVVELARRWFGYTDTSNGNEYIHTYVGDGRSWLAAQDTRYDAIVLDTYFADSIPFHLTTKEFFESVRAHLKPEGVAAANLIGAITGRRNELLRSMHKTWSSVFDDVVLYPIPDATNQVDLTRFINIELFAARRSGVLPPRGGESVLFEQAEFAIDTARVFDVELRRTMVHRYAKPIDSTGVPVLTDDLAPVDSLLQVEGI